MTNASPYLTVADASAAIRFYETVFGATVQGKMEADDGKRLMHANLDVMGAEVMLSDEFPEWSPIRAPQEGSVSPVAVSLRLGEAGEVDRVHGLALENGATELQAPENMFWGDRFSQLTDPFGHRWMLVATVEEQDG